MLTSIDAKQPHDFARFNQICSVSSNFEIAFRSEIDLISFMVELGDPRPNPNRNGAFIHKLSYANFFTKATKKVHLNQAVAKKKIAASIFVAGGIENGSECS